MDQQQAQVTAEEILAVITGSATDLYKGFKQLQAEYNRLSQKAQGLEDEIKKLKEKKKPKKGGKKNGGTR